MRKTASAVTSPSFTIRVSHHQPSSAITSRHFTIRVSRHSTMHQPAGACVRQERLADELPCLPDRCRVAGWRLQRTEVACSPATHCGRVRPSPPLPAPCRYAKFWVLQLIHEDEVLLPAADMGLMWLAHMAMAGHYALACRHFEVAPLCPKYLALSGEAWAGAYARTKGLYEQRYGAHH